MAVTSFVAWDGAAGRPLDDETRAFLEAGPPPVLVTLGSNGAIQPDDGFFDQAARSVLDQGLRALVVTGPGGRSGGGVAGRGDVHVTDYVPFGEVMDGCRAAVHHAGVGTTVAAIRAGLPQVVVPRGFDQPDTAARIEVLGIGLSAPWGRRPRRLGSALHRVLTEPRFSEAAAAPRPARP